MLQTPSDCFLASTGARRVYWYLCGGVQAEAMLAGYLIDGCSGPTPGQTAWYGCQVSMT